MSTQSFTESHPARAPRLLGRAAASRWAPLPIVLAGTFMVVLDFFIVNVALPSMQTSLNASSGALEWVAAGYGLTSAVFLITSARLGDRIGRRRVFSLGLALFTLSSVACGAATSSEILIAGRLVQGVAGALLMPNVLSIIGVLYRGPDRARALSAYAMVMGLAAVGGQLIGGILVQANVAGLGWRTCFLINVPVGVLALTFAPRVVPESHDPRSSTIDWAGTALVTAGLIAIVLPLIEGRQHGWPAWTWILLGAAPLILGTFVVQQRRLARRCGAPLLELSLFSQRTFSAGLVAQLVFWCGQASFFLVLALYLQQGRGLSALNAGLVFTILAVAYLVASMVAPALAESHGRRVLAAGALVLACGHAVLVGTVADIGAGVSARHLSFVETGRSKPSPEMVLHLAEQLQVPLRERNRLLLAAGYAPQYGARSMEEPEMAPIREAVGRVLLGHEPYPAFAVDRGWNLIASNGALAPLLDGVAVELLQPPVNCMRLAL